MFFKKSNVLLWKNESNSEFKIDDILVKASRLKPSWYESLDLSFHNKRQTFNVKACPSFIELFKNSLVYISPCDFKLEYGIHGYTFTPSDNTILKSSSHTHTVTGDGSQMGPNWNKNLHNIKLQPPICIKSKSKLIRSIFLPCFYHNQNPKLEVATGIVDFIPNGTTFFNLNLFYNTAGFTNTETKTLEIKAGEPLAYILFPDKIPQFIESDFKEIPRKLFIGDYYKKIKDYKSGEKKCPFHV